jgi:hypothetical protein
LLLFPQKYKAKSEVLIANPLIADRNYIFRSTEPRYIDFFANEDDIDHVMSIAFSHNVMDSVVKNMKLFEAYKLDDTDKKDKEKMEKIWENNYDVKRTEYKNMEISFQDYNAQRAAAVVNDAVNTIERSYRGYYNLIKEQINNSLKTRIKENDSTINSLTDSIVHLQLSMTNGQSGNTFKTNSLIHTIEAIKEQCIVDQAKYVGLVNEFATGTNSKEMDFIHVITPALPPTNTVGLGKIMSLTAILIVSLFLSSIIVLLSAYFKALTAVQR